MYEYVSEKKQTKRIGQFPPIFNVDSLSLYKYPLTPSPAIEFSAVKIQY